MKTDKENQRITATDSTGIWSVPLDVIAKHRADYYQAKESSSVAEWQSEYDYLMDDIDEAIDWFRNNMDWDDVSKHATVMRHEHRTEPQDWRKLEWDLT